MHILKHILFIIKMYARNNIFKQMQVYTIQRLELETGKTCEACSIVHWEGTCRRP